MIEPSPICTVDSKSTADGYVDAVPGATVTIGLQDATGAKVWKVECVYTDDLNSPQAVTASLDVDHVAKTAQFTAPAEGSSLIFESTVNGGVDENGNTRADYKYRFKVCVPINNLRTLASNETTEHDRKFGWTPAVNDVIRNGGGAAGGGGGGSPTGAAGGDLGGTYPNPLVTKLNGVTVTGTPASGKVLTANSPTTASWQDAVSGGAPSGAAGGDLSGTYPNPNVAKANGATLPAGTGLTTGNVLKATGTSTLGYGPVNLAGGSGHVTGTLPVANLPSATTSANGIVRLAGDLGGTATAPSVLKVNGIAVSGSPTDGQVLTANSTTTATWMDPPSGGGLTGYSSNGVTLTVTGIENVEETIGTRGFIGTYNRDYTVTGSTLTDVFNWTIADGAVTKVTVEAVGITSTGTVGASYVRSMTFRSSGGAVSAIGAVNQNETEEDSSTWDCTITNTGTTGYVRVQGDAGTTRWLVSIRLARIGAA